MSFNPAYLSSTLQRLFPAGVVVAELRAAGDPALLLPAEAENLGRSVPKRIGEFSAGRLCARRALLEFGISDFALRVAHDRQPIWPDGIVGSITHTQGLCAAAVAERRHLLAIGLDCELIGAPSMDLWSTICGAEELSWIRELPAGERPAAVTLIFSAKEAFYKCQYPLTREWLDFHDLEVGFATWEPSASFTVGVTRPIALSKFAVLPLSGRFAIEEPFVAAAVAMEPCENPVSAI